MAKTRLKGVTKYHAVEFSTDTIERGSMVFSTRAYNKMKSQPGYKEYDYACFQGEKPLHIHNSILSEMETMGAEKFGPYNDKYVVINHFGDATFGFIIYRD